MKHLVSISRSTTRPAIAGGELALRIVDLLGLFVCGVAGCPPGYLALRERSLEKTAE